MRVAVEPPNRSGIDHAGGQGELDLRALGQALWGRKMWILLPTLAAALIAFVVVQFVTPRYKSEARVLFEGRENIFLRPEAEKAMTDRGTVDPETLASQIQLVLSRDLAREVIGQLKLGERAEFDPMLRGASLLRLALSAVGITRDPTRMTAEERVFQTYYERLTAYAVEKSRVIVIEFQSQDPDLAARVANAIAERYLSFQQGAKQEQARAAGQWLAGEITILRTKVADAEDKVEEFRAKSNLFLGTNNTSLSNQQLGDFSAQLSAARAQKSDAETRSRLIRDLLKAGRTPESAEMTNSELIRRLTEQRVALRAQLAEQSSTLLDFHPRIKELKAQIADLDRQIRDEAERLVRSLENDAKIAGARLESLTASLDQMKRQAASTNGQDVQLRALEREAKAQRDLLESYLAKYREATARESIDAAPADGRVISRATVSNTPVFPKKVPIVLIATMVVFVISSAFIVTGELLRANAPSPLVSVEPAVVPIAPAAEAADPSEAAAVRTTAPPGAASGHEATIVGTQSIGGRTVRDVGRFSDAHPALAVPLGTLTDLAGTLREAGAAGRRVTVLGAVREIDTGLIALTLARTLARESRVVCVDLALGASGISVASSDPAGPGIADVVRGTASFGQIISRDKLSAAHLVAAGRAIEDAAPILASQRLATTIEALAQTYDHVVVHAGAVPEMGVERFARLAPKAVLVAFEADEIVTEAVRERLLSAGFTDVVLLAREAAGEAEPERSGTPVEAA